jgi:hypothetical protein
MAKIELDNKPSLAVIEVKLICPGWPYPVMAGRQRISNAINLIAGIYDG